MQMYIPEHFSFEDRQEILAFARQYSFAVLVSVDGDSPYASHIPLLVKESDAGIWLEGHMASANPHRELLVEGTHMAIFHGPHAYVSPTWYQNPGVPTWNYLAVHMSGPVTLVEETDRKKEIVAELSDFFESANAEPWPGRYAPAMLHAITGFRMDVESLSGKKKLSQNREAVDRAGVIRGLEKPFGKEPDSWELETRKRMMDAMK